MSKRLAILPGLLIALWVLLLSPACTFPPEEPEPEPQQWTVLYSYEAVTDSLIPGNYLAQLISTADFPDFADNLLQQYLVYGVEVYRVVYKTTYKGNEKLASGLVVIPEMDQPRPIVSYQHGTILEDSRVPSKFQSVLSMEPEMALMLAVGSTGFICAAPDYLGYGQSTDVLHPYHHAESLAAAGVDLLRAVKELCRQLDIPYKSEYYLTGYSEGGYATLALMRTIETDFAGEFPLKAVSAGAGAYVLSDTAQQLVQRQVLPVPAYVGFLLTAYLDMFDPQREVGEVFREPYAERIRGGLFYGDYSSFDINALLSFFTEELFTQQFLIDFRGAGETTLKNALQQNNLHTGWVPSAPLRLYHGTLDPIVPAENSETAVNSFTANGAVDVTYIALPGRTHETGILPWLKETLLWFVELK